MVWIKVCGITNLQDARLVAAAGADALGFIFAPSPRRVEPERVREIIAGLPVEIAKIGVFIDEPGELVRETARICGLTGVQLHGRESPEYCRGLDGLKVIKVFRVGKEIDYHLIRPYLEPGCIRKILFDTFDDHQAGGTGKIFSWEIISREDWRGIPVIMAGGLHPGNVKEAIRVVKPYGIDVCSGVEKEPGKKDIAKVRDFIANARGCING